MKQPFLTLLCVENNYLTWDFSSKNELTFSDSLAIDLHSLSSALASHTFLWGGGEGTNSHGQGEKWTLRATLSIAVLNYGMMHKNPQAHPARHCF